MERAALAFRAGDDRAANAALMEAEAALPEALPSEMPWPARAMDLNRARAGLAQKQVMLLTCRSQPHETSIRLGQ